jgi:hypothetical protein
MVGLPLTVVIIGGEPKRFRPLIDLCPAGVNRLDRSVSVKGFIPTSYSAEAADYYGYELERPACSLLRFSCLDAKKPAE